MSALNLRHFERAQSASERATILAACEEVGLGWVQTIQRATRGAAPRAPLRQACVACARGDTRSVRFQAVRTRYYKAI